MGNYLIDGLSAVVSLLNAEQNSLSANTSTAVGLDNCLSDTYKQAADSSSYWTSKIEGTTSSKNIQKYTEEAQLATTTYTNYENTISGTTQVSTQAATTIGNAQSALSTFVAYMLGPLNQVLK